MHVFYSMASIMFDSKVHTQESLLRKVNELAKERYQQGLHGPIDVKAVLEPYKDDALIVFDGGEDVNPALYGERNIYSNINTHRDAWEKSIFDAAMELKIPMLGICRGSQLLCALNGGTLYQDLRAQRGKGHSGDHTVTYTDDAYRTGFVDLMRSCPLGFDVVNSYHHQGVKSLPDYAIILATAYDGLIEGVLYPNQSLAVQWHPEYIGHDEFLDHAKKIITGA